MTEFLQSHWLDLLGIVLSGGGLGVALYAALSARSAKSAAIEARDSIARRMTSVDVERAIGLIERLKDRHVENRWKEAVERYPELRAMLFDIRARLPDDVDPKGLERLTNAAGQVRELEDQVNENMFLGKAPANAVELTRMLNRIQSLLQELASGLNWDSGKGGN